MSAQRALLRKNDSDQVDTISKTADPGKFKDKKKWPDWEPALINYLSTIPGVKGIPLSYVVRANEKRALLGKNDSDQVDTISKTADPGKFKDKKKWPDWEPAFINYLSTIPGVKGIPLSYVVRTNEDPDHKTNFEGDFVACSIACAPLNNATFRADA